ncbi:MAG: hypothetical protein QM780_01020 [Hyphomicrobium sp.]|uniref:hypothetical protein n=1 Tax=Hyphomicrobium sp. TaxID=82 RepID=UPI0039E5398A
MTSLRALALAAMATAVWASPGRADQCEAVAANVGAQVPEIKVAGHATVDQTVVVTLKNPDIDELTLTCENGDVERQPELTAKANATWPSSNFYDVLASAGAVISASTTSAIRSGSVLCAQRAMNANDNSAIYDVNGIHFECVTTTGTGGSTRIRISKLKEAPPQ